MKQTAQYHFYAAHRNQNLQDKCHNLHGHTYFVEFDFEFKSLSNGLTMLFSELDSKIEPIIKGKYDHATFVDINDEQLMKCINQFPDVFGKVVTFEQPTSVEFLAQKLFTEMVKLGLPITSVRIKETTTKIIEYKYNG